MKSKLGLVLIFTCIIFMSGCNFLSNEFGKINESLKGREVVIHTYDEDSNIIDKISGGVSKLKIRQRI